MSLASVRWNGGSHVFHVPTDLNVRATFGSAAFLVDARRCVVRLDAAGAPSPPLVAGEAYVAYSGGSRELHRQLHALRGQLAAARNEQTKLRERLAKFEACTRAEMLAIAQMLHPSSITPPPSSATPPPSSTTPPPSSTTPPPSSATPTPSSTTPPPSSATPTPSSTTPPPSSTTPPPSSITPPPSTTPPPSSTTPPPSSTTPPPSSITPPPSSTTPPPSSITPPPSSTTPPPSSATPTPSSTTPPPSSATPTPSSTTPPPSSTTPPPSSTTPPPSSATPTPSSTTPPPSSITPPPSSATPPPSSTTPPPSSATPTPSSTTPPPSSTTPPPSSITPPPSSTTPPPSSTTSPPSSITPPPSSTTPPPSSITPPPSSTPHPSSTTPPPSSITPPPSSTTPPPSSTTPPPSSITPPPSSTPHPSSTTPPPSSITPPPSSITPTPSSTTPPPSSTTPPPSSITPPPSSITPTPSSTTPPPSSTTPTPSSIIPPPSSTTPPPSSTTPPPPSDEWRGRPIGVLHSVWVEKNGTPRQGSVCAASVAELRIRVAGLNACHALEGLGSFSHVWLLFVFHKNGGAATKSKVQPPRLDGVKVGLFATRTPHRPNNLGLSLARLVAVRGDTLHLAAVDLIDGTPVMDVKPFVPFADSAVAPTVAPWLAVPPTPELSVDFTAAALAQLRALAPSLRLLRGEEQAKQAITEVLGGDPRSVHWRQYGFSIDTLNVVSRFEGTNVIVEQVQHIDLCDRSHIKGEAAMAAKAPVAGGAELATPDLPAAEASR